MNAFMELKKFFKTDLINFAKQLNYSQFNVELLSENKNECEKKINLFNIDGVQLKNILSCSQQKDGRSPLDFAKDIVANWIFEDYLIDYIKNDKFKIIAYGVDKERNFLHTMKIKYDSDYKIKYKEKTFLMELSVNYLGYWQRENKLHLRCKKYDYLKRSNSLFLGIDMQNKKFILMDFATNFNSIYIEPHPPWQKPAYEINIHYKENAKHLSKDNLMNSICNILDMRT